MDLDGYRNWSCSGLIHCKEPNRGELYLAGWLMKNTVCEVREISKVLTRLRVTRVRLCSSACSLPRSSRSVPAVGLTSL